MQDDKYFSRSWAMLKKQPGWIKPLLVMAIATLVPIAGPLGVNGYVADYGRRVAWGSDEGPKRQGIKVGELIGTGWRVFCASILWILVWSLLTFGISFLFTMAAGRAGSAISNILLYVGSLFVMMIINVAIMRAVIYTKATAGINPSRVFELVGRDPKGLFKIVLIPFVGSLIVFLIMLIMYVIIIVIVFADTAAAAANVTSMGYSSAMSSYFTGVLIKVIPVALIFGYVGSVFMAAINLLTMSSVGLWLRQFNVPAWGGPDDPLPPAQPVLPSAGMGGYAGGYQASPQAGYMPTSQQGYGAPAQQGYAQPGAYQQQMPSGYPQQQVTPQPSYPQPTTQPGYSQPSYPQAQQPAQPSYPQASGQPTYPQASQPSYPQSNAYQQPPVQEPAPAPQPTEPQGAAPVQEPVPAAQAGVAPVPAPEPQAPGQPQTPGTPQVQGTPQTPGAPNA